MFPRARPLAESKNNDLFCSRSHISRHANPMIVLSVRSKQFSRSLQEIDIPRELIFAKLLDSTRISRTVYIQPFETQRVVGNRSKHIPVIISYTFFIVLQC